MLTLTNLSATRLETDFRDPDSRHAALDEPKPGWLRHIRFGPNGLIIKHGDDAVAIPLAELLKLAETAHPKLIPPAPTPAPPEFTAP